MSRLSVLRRSLNRAAAALSRVFRFDERGSVLLMAVAIAPFLIALAVGTYNVGAVVGEKIRLQRAADVGAYTGAVWRARQLNFVALTNRCQAADYGLIGLIVSLKANAEFLRDAWTVIGTIASVVPGIGPAINQAGTAGTTAYVNVARALQYAIPPINRRTRFVSEAQAAFVHAVDLALAPVETGLPNFAADILENIDPRMELEPIVGAVNIWESSKTFDRAVHSQMQDVWRGQLPKYWRGATWYLPMGVPPPRYRRKTKGELWPAHDIVASEAFQTWGYIIFGFGYRSVWSRTARASDAFPTAGAASPATSWNQFHFWPYMDFSDERKRQIREEGLFPSFTTLVSLPADELPTVKIFGHDATRAMEHSGLLSFFSGKLWALSRAEVIYQPRADEAPNLFNPYWTPRLVPVSRLFDENGSALGLGDLVRHVIRH
jgi:hypothetical protein